MQLPYYFDQGKASVANGGTTVTFTGTALGTSAQPAIWPGDIFDDPAQSMGFDRRIESIDYNAKTAVLSGPWLGTSLVSADYRVYFIGIVERSTAQTRRLLEELSVVEANGRGLFYTFDTTTTDADPGAGKFRLNNATIGSATAAYLDNLDADGAAVSTILDTWDDAGSSVGRGQLWLRSIADPAIFHAFNVTGSVVDGTGYRKLTVSYVGGAGSFAAADEIMVAFLPLGAAGPTGADGGITMTFSTTTTAADPGAGKFRFNNATHASATALYIDNVEALAGATISGLVDTWDDSSATIKGVLTIIAQDNPSIWRAYSVTGSVVDSTGYRTVTIAYLAGNGTLPDATNCSVLFSRTGNNGTNGSNGVTPGLRYTFSSTTTDSDPGAGTLRLNNATMASVTAAYIDNLDSDGATVTAALDTWDDSTATVKGILTIRSAGTPASFAQFNVSGTVVDGTGYRKLTLAHLASNGAFGNGDAISVQFTRTGDNGGGVSTGKAIAMALVFGG
jgi:hypothetical protein